MAEAARRLAALCGCRRPEVHRPVARLAVEMHEERTKVERIEVPLTKEEALALAAAMAACRDASAATHWRLGRSRLDGSVLSMHPKWAGVPVAEYLGFMPHGPLASVRQKIESTWRRQDHASRAW